MRARFYRPRDALPRACARGAGLSRPFRISPAPSHFDWCRRPGFDACVTGMGGLGRRAGKSRSLTTILLALSEVWSLTLYPYARGSAARAARTFPLPGCVLFRDPKSNVPALQPPLASLPMAPALCLSPRAVRGSSALIGVDVSACAPQLALLI